MKHRHSLPLLATIVLSVLATTLTGCRTARLSQTGTIIDIGQLGAVGDGVADNRPVFEKALGLAAEAGDAPVTIVVPDGTYRLVLTKDDKAFAHLAIEKQRNLTIAARNQALLLCGSPYHHGIGILDSHNITVRGLAVDYDPLPFTQGIITAISQEQNYLDLRVEDGFPAPTASHIDSTVGKCKNVGYTFEPETGRKLNQFYDLYLRTQVQDLGNGIYRYPINRTEPEMVGKRFVVVGRRKADAFKIHFSTDCLLERVAVYSSPACGYNLSDSTNVTITHSAIRQRPNSGRAMSTNADGLHSKWCPNGPTLSYCEFTGMGDDSVNVGGSYVPIIDRVNDRTIIVEVHGSLTRFPDEFVSFDPVTHGHFPLPRIENIDTAAVDGYKRPCLRLTFKEALPELTTWQDTKNKRKCQQVLNLNACGRGARILNNYFHDHRVRGVLMRGPDSIIRGNRFENLAGPAIVVSNDGGFLAEGPSGDGTVIEDNTCLNIERSNIWINSSVGTQSESATQGVVGVKIIDNRFDQYGGQNVYGRGVVGNVLWIKNASDLVIRGNTIGKPADGSAREPVALVKNNGMITWLNNTVEGRPLDPAQDVQTMMPSK